MVIDMADGGLEIPWGLFGNGIPDLREPKSLKILHVGRGELGDSEGTECQGGAGVVDAAAGDAGSGGILPEVGVDFAAGGWEAEDPPAGMLAVALHDLHRIGCGERLLQDGWVAQQEVKLGEHELAQGHALAP